MNWYHVYKDNDAYRTELTSEGYSECGVWDDDDHLYDDDNYMGKFVAYDAEDAIKCAKRREAALAATSDIELPPLHPKKEVKYNSVVYLANPDYRKPCWVMCDTCLKKIKDEYSDVGENIFGEKAVQEIDVTDRECECCKEE